jgi:hypothetical protein
MKYSKIVLPFLIGAVILCQLGFSANPYKGMTWAVGQWVEYQMKSDTQDMQMKYSITGSQIIDGKTYYWFETSMDTKQGRMIMKMLMAPGDPEPKQFIQKMGDRPAMDMTAMMQSGRSQRYNNKPPIHRDEDINKGIIGVESVTVPAGTFLATHAKIVNNDNQETNEVWVSSKVPIIGAVKSTATGKYNSSLTLLKYGTSGATTEITETPQKFDLNNMMNMRRGNSSGGE